MSDALAVVHPTPEPRIAGDTSKYFMITLVSKATGLPFELGGTVTTFKLVTFEKDVNGLRTVIVNDMPCEQSGGSVWYVPQPADVATPGHYLGRFKIVTSDGVIKLGHFKYSIAADI